MSTLAPDSSRPESKSVAARFIALLRRLAGAPILEVNTAACYVVAVFETPPLAEVQRFARAMSSSVPAVEDTLPDLLPLLRATGRPFRIVGGVAVIHHGYVRSTRDVDVLITADHGLDTLASAFGFERVGATRLRHRSGTLVALLIAGTPSLRPGEAPYPEPWELDPSPRDPEVVGLQGLVKLKLAARRAQDRADLVALLKLLSETEYLEIEAGVPPEKRRAVWSLREEALEELAMDRATEIL